MERKKAGDDHDQIPGQHRDIEPGGQPAWQVSGQHGDQQKTDDGQGSLRDDDIAECQSHRRGIRDDEGRRGEYKGWRHAAVCSAGIRLSRIRGRWRDPHAIELRLGEHSGWYLSMAQLCAQSKFCPRM